MAKAPIRRWLSLRSPRSVLSAFCFTLSVALSLLWVRSYWWADSLIFCNRKGLLELSSFDGRIHFYLSPGEFPPDTAPLRLLSATVEDIQRRGDELRKLGLQMPEPRVLGFGWGGMFKRQYGGMAPFWFLVAIAASAAIALKPSPRYRFSLFDFLALTTFAALVAASVACLVRLRQ